MTSCQNGSTDPACQPADESGGNLPNALTVTLVVVGFAVIVLIITCCVAWRLRTRRKPRTEKKLLRELKLDTLENPTPIRHSYIYGVEESYRHEDDEGGYKRQSGVFVHPPGTAPYVDPTPNVKVIRQPNQEGTPAVFRNDIDKWGTYNVVYVDGKNNVSPPGSRTSWHKQYKVVHGGPEFKDYYYRLYPKGNEDNLKEYDYIPIKVEPGALGPYDGSVPPQQTTLGGSEDLTVINSNTSINGYHNDQELLINPARLSSEPDHVHRGVEMRHSNRQKRQGMHFGDNMDNDDSDTHSVVQSLATKPDGTPEHRVSLNVVYEE